MKTYKKLPFQDLTSTGWQNLAMATLLIFYVIQIGFELFWHNTCGHLALDFCAFWSAGSVANTDGFASVYNLKLIGEVQKSIFPRLTATSPIPFLPIFIIPFQPFASLNVNTSFWVWTMINLVVLFFYLCYLSNYWSDKPHSIRFIFMIAISLPVFINIFTGQVNIWLMVCMGEFMRNILKGKSYLGGLWLGGLLLKPQTLILIVPFLVLTRSYKVLSGWLSSSVVIMAVSLALVGFNGLQKLGELWLGYVGGIPTNDVEIMMNWAMVGLHLSSVTSSLFGWIVIGLGTFLTVLACFTIWRRPVNFQSTTFVFALLGTLAATCLTAWHSHTHMAVIIIPALIYLKVHNQLPDKVINAWVFLPAGIYAAVFIIAAFVSGGFLPASLNGLLNFLRGAGEFGINIYLLIWVMRFFPNENLEVHTQVPVD